MDGPSDCHPGRSESDGEGGILYGIPSLWNLKRKDTENLLKKTERDSQT